MRVITILFLGLLSFFPPTSYTASHHSKHVHAHNTKENIRYKYKIDSAPAADLQLPSFKELTPKKEPLSRYGNPSQYYVDGHRYEVMKSSLGYKTRGIASWYGAKFHKQRTSSGEFYNMYTMSAAHKTLPLPTYVRVKNLDNGKIAVVRVNDRGPFHPKRIIDLSYAAAVKLGVFPTGTAHVEIETMVAPIGKAHYYVQAGAFTSELSAQKLKNKIVKLTPSPVFIEHFKEHYVVRVGPFGAKHMADNLKQRLYSHGVKGSFALLV